MQKKPTKKQQMQSLYFNVTCSSSCVHRTKTYAVISFCSRWKAFGTNGCCMFNERSSREMALHGHSLPARLLFFSSEKAYILSNFCITVWSASFLEQLSVLTITTKLFTFLSIWSLFSCRRNGPVHFFFSPLTLLSSSFLLHQAELRATDETFAVC